MTYKANSIVNIPVVATDNLTLFNQDIYPIMNVTVNPLTTYVEGLPIVTIASGSNGQTLPQSVIFVNSTTGIPTPPGTSYIYINGVQISYTGITGGGTPSFTGCSGGTGTLSTGDPITLAFPYTPLPVASTAGFPTSGTIFGSVAYTGTTSTSFTGVTGGTGVTISNGQSVSLNTSCFWLGFPKGIPFTMGLRNTLSSGINPFLASASGNAASLISAETTIASGSNGQTLPQSVIFVASTQYYPSSGYVNITDFNGIETIHYTSITGGGTPSFNGCSGGTGTLSTGDTVLPTGYNTALTGLNNVTGIEQNNVAVGNAGSLGNSIGLNGSGATFINSTSVGVTTSGTLPDPNNGSILWALTDYVYDGSVNVTNDGLPDSGNSIYYFVCDGYNVRLAQPFKQNYWSNENFTVNDGFNYGVPSNGNLTSITLVAGSLTGDFDAAIPGPEPFMQTISNTTSFTATVGYSHDGSTFTGNTITISPNTESFVAGDETNVFAPGAPSTAPIPSVLINTGYTIVSDPSGTTYLVEATFNPNIILPDAPVDGTYYIFKDQNYSFSPNSQLTVQTQGSDEIEWGGAGNTLTTANFTNPGLSFTLEYFDTDAVWRVINKTDNELAPITVLSSGVTFFATDFRQVDYYIDTSSEVPAVFGVYDTSYTPLDGQEFSLKDPEQSWGLYNVTLNFSNNLEYPAGTLNSSSVTINTNGQYVRWRFNPQTAIWQLIASSPDFYSGATRPTTATIGFMFFDTTLDSGTGAGGQPIWSTRSVWVTADGNIA